MRIPIVDENDVLIEYRERDDNDVVAIRRVSFLWVTNSKGDILLARRGWEKKHGAGKWGPAVAGTVEEGETYESNIIKEMDEEIGLKNLSPILSRKIRINNCFCQGFDIVLDKDASEFKLQEKEVAEVKWFTREQLRKELNEHPENFLVQSIHEKLKD